MRTLHSFDVQQPARWLLAFDFDGTLVNPETSPVTRPEFFELIKMLRRSERACWAINTGRSLMHTVEGIMQANFPFLPDYLIVREREIYCPNELGRFVPDLSWNKPCDKAHKKLFRKHRRLLKRIRQFVETETSAGWGEQEGETDGIVATSSQEMDVIVEFINRAAGSASDLSYQRNSIYLRFSHADYHKGTAMREVAHQLGLSPEKTFAIGDSHNDLDMLDGSMAAHLACPSNAVPLVKKHVAERGGYLASLPASLGVIESLNALFIEAAS